MLGRINLWAAAIALLATAIPARAQEWPAYPIHMVLGFPAGPVDIVGRPVAARLQQSLGQNVIFENRPGANGAIASEQIARAAPDGYQILLATSGTHVTSVHLTKNLRYDPVADFEPIIAAVEPVTCLVVHPSVPANSVPELVAYLKANPGKLSFGTSGVGSVFHLTGELFKQTAGVEMTHVPYKGLDPAMNDLIGGHVLIGFTALSTAAPHIDSGKVKLLAVLEPRRFPRRADTPSISEAIPAFQKPSTWFGFFGPRGLPGPIVAKLNAEIDRILKEPELTGRFQDAGYAVIGGTPEQLRDLMADGIKRFGEIIHKAGIQPE